LRKAFLRKLIRNDCLPSADILNYYLWMQLRPFQLATISGIPLKVDLLWLPMVTIHFWIISKLSISYQSNDSGTDDGGISQALFFGAIQTFLIFVSIIVHELGHALVARLEGINTTEIRLHVFGGYARLASDPKTAMAELRIAIAGPVASFMLGLFFLIFLLATQAFITGKFLGLLGFTFLYLFTGNMALAMFNLIPGLPLDGGRVLRAYLWHRKKDIVAATLVAKNLGVALAYMLAAYAAYRLLWWSDPYTAIWMIILAFMLKRSAEEDYRYRKMQSDYQQEQNIAGTVATVMSRPAITVAPNMSVNEFIDQILDKHRHTSYPVTQNGRLHGMLHLEKLRGLPEGEWHQKTVREVMLPVDESFFVPAKASLEFATSKIKATPLHHLAVIDNDGIVVGYLSPKDLNLEIAVA
jgi:Zn-dependent protease/CBS domain-containing protein